MTCISETYPGVMELHLPTYPLVMTNSFLLKMAMYSDVPLQTGSLTYPILRK